MIMKKNDKIIKKFFLRIDFKKVRMRKIYCTKCKKYKEFKILYICHKRLLLFIICNRCGSEDERLFIEGESTEKLKILGLINHI